MTENEWQSCSDPQKMLEFLRGKASDRKLLLFAITCLRQAKQAQWGKETASQELEIAERYADGEATLERFRDIFDFRDLGTGEGDTLLAHPPRFPIEAAVQFAREGAAIAARAATTAFEVSAAKGIARVIQCRLLRCIFGTPVRPVALVPAWLAWNNATVVRLAQAAYEERHLPEGTLDNGRLAVLADALEEAGCQDQNILAHCRSGGEHVRGCWVIDLLLGRS